MRILFSLLASRGSALSLDPGAAADSDPVGREAPNTAAEVRIHLVGDLQA